MTAKKEENWDHKQNMGFVFLTTPGCEFRQWPIEEVSAITIRTRVDTIFIQPTLVHIIHFYKTLNSVLQILSNGWWIEALPYLPAATCQPTAQLPFHLGIPVRL